MVGDIAATLDMHQGDLPCCQEGLRDHKVLSATAPAEGKSARVLGDEKEIVGRLTAPSVFDQGKL